MEKRAILAAVLMAGLLILYQFLFTKPEPTQPPDNRAKEAPVAGTPATPPARAQHEAAMLPPAKAAASVPDRTATVDTPLYRAEFGSNGGAIKAWELDYRGQKPLAVGPALAFQGIEVGRPGMATGRCPCRSRQNSSS